MHNRVSENKESSHGHPASTRLEEAQRLFPAVLKACDNSGNGPIMLNTEVRKKILSWCQKGKGAPFSFAFPLENLQRSVPSP